MDRFIATRKMTCQYNHGIVSSDGNRNRFSRTVIQSMADSTPGKENRLPPTLRV